MKTYFVPILLRSICQNSNVGETASVFEGVGKVNVSFVGDMPEFLKEGENFFATSWTVSGGYKETEGELSGSDVIKDVIKNKELFRTIEITNNPIILNHLPIPKYTYKHKNIDVMCSHCGSTVKVEDLEFDIDVVNECHIDNICPVCDTPDCVALEYEKIEGAIKRKKSKIKIV